MVPDGGGIPLPWRPPPPTRGGGGPPWLAPDAGLHDIVHDDGQCGVLNGRYSARRRVDEARLRQLNPLRAVEGYSAWHWGEVAAPTRTEKAEAK
eukprot:gene43195-66385_t